MQAESLAEACQRCRSTGATVQSIGLSDLNTMTFHFIVLRFAADYAGI
jgi:hypothetical protein